MNIGAESFPARRHFHPRISREMQMSEGMHVLTPDEVTRLLGGRRETDCSASPAVPEAQVMELQRRWEIMRRALPLTHYSPGDLLVENSECRTSDGEPLVMLYMRPLNVHDERDVAMLRVFCAQTNSTAGVLDMLCMYFNSQLGVTHVTPCASSQMVPWVPGHRDEPESAA